MKNKIGRVSTNLWRYEVACKCGCGFDTVDTELAVLFEVVREFGVREFSWKGLTPSSGCRCLNHNEAIQKKYTKKYIAFSSKSTHMYGRALDFKLPLFQARSIYDYLCNMYPGKYGFGLYTWGIHIDTKSGPARRWDRT